MYICDSRGVRDIYDTDGTDALAASEPLAVLVCFFFFFGKLCWYAFLYFIVLEFYAFVYFIVLEFGYP